MASAAVGVGAVIFTCLPLELSIWRPVIVLGSILYLATFIPGID